MHVDRAGILAAVIPPPDFEVGGDRTTFALGVLRVTQVACVVAAVLSFLRLLDLVSSLAALFLFALDLLHLVSAVAFLVWLRRAHANLALLGIPTRHGSTAAVAMFFIPIANLLLPTFVVGDVWNASAPTSRLRRAGGTRIEVVRWWSVYLVASFLYGAGRYLAMDDDLRAVSSALLVIACALGSLAAQLTTTLITDIDRREKTLLTQKPEAQVLPSRERGWRDYLMPVSRALEDELASGDDDSR